MPQPRSPAGEEQTATRHPISERNGAHKACPRRERPGGSGVECDTVPCFYSTRWPMGSGAVSHDRPDTEPVSTLRVRSLSGGAHQKIGREVRDSCLVELVDEGFGMSVGVDGYGARNRARCRRRCRGRFGVVELVAQKHRLRGLGARQEARSRDEVWPLPPDSSAATASVACWNAAIVSAEDGDDISVTS